MEPNLAIPGAPAIDGRQWGVWALIALAVSLASMLVLHLVQRDLNPWHEPISFYVHGRFGWLLTIALVSFGTATLALVNGWQPRDAPWLAIFGAGMLLTGLIESDPYFPWEDTPTFGGAVHAFVAVVAPPLLLPPMLRQFFAMVGEPLQELLQILVLAYVLGLLACATSLVVGYLLEQAPAYLGLAERVLGLAAWGWLGLLALLLALGRTGRRV